MTANSHVPFEPFPLLHNPHLMTIVPTLVPRRFPAFRRSRTERYFRVGPGAKILTHCHWQAERKKHPTLILLHGLEGSSESPAVLGVTVKALARQFNVVRMNMRNCGGTEHLTPTLYDSGMSHDLLTVINELKEEGLSEFLITGWSMGGNIVLKAAAELADLGPECIAAVCAISPALDLPSCIQVLDTGFNRFYEQHFLSGLKALLRRKASIFPELFDLTLLNGIGSIKQFDETFTARFGGWGSADAYYEKASALPVINKIGVPTLILQAKDDPLIPFASFETLEAKNSNITLIATEYGGHAGFLQKQVEAEPDLDLFWAENRAVQFLRNNSSLREKPYLEFI